MREEDQKGLDMVRARRLAHRNELMCGVTSLPQLGTPGTIVVFGDEAFPVAVVQTGASSPPQCFVAAATTRGGEGGRVVSFSHTDYGSSKSKDMMSDMMKNCLLWAGKKIAGDKAVVAVLGKDSQHGRELIEAAGLSGGMAVGDAAVTPDANGVAFVLKADPDILIWAASRYPKVEISPDENDKRVELILDHVVGGMGLITTMCPWGWGQVSGGGDLQRACLFNRVLERVGLFYTGAYLKSSPTGYPTDVDEALYDAVHVGDGLKRILSTSVVGGVCNSITSAAAMDGVSSLPPSVFVVCADRLSSSQQNAILSRRLLHRQQENKDHPNVFSGDAVENCGVLLAEISQHQAKAAPTGDISESWACRTFPNISFPMCSSNSLDIVPRIEMETFDRLWQQVPIRDIGEAPCISHMPGRCVGAQCSAEEFPDLIRHSFAVAFSANSNTKEWTSTGLYAPPGQAVQLRCSPSATKSLPAIMLRIGCHSDHLHPSGNFTLKRYAKVSHSFPVKWGGDDGCCFTAGSPFGGLVYIETDKARGSDEGPFSVEISGCVMAPYFKSSARLPAGTPAKEVKRDYPHEKAWPELLVDGRGAPWGEIEGEHLVISFPRTSIVSIEQPYQVTEFWDQVIKWQMELASITTLPRKERIVPDVQISAGSMHAGYPIMTHMDVVDGSGTNLADLDKIRKEGCWGVFHELGHNRQKPEWTFKGTGEVTVNLFTLYVFQKLLGQSPFETDWVRRNSLPAGYRYLNDASQSFDSEWIKKAGLALCTYATLIEMFGWDALISTIKSYNEDKIPHNSNDTVKISTWVLRYSQFCGTDLRGYFKGWKFPADALGEPKLEALSALPRLDLHVAMELMKGTGVVG
eukprot:GHVN01000771.1.p1 GENE.GHVN01000771.1~~GHVN01000771.1.p1  ORF type:complete len:861 (+),score=105.35 GHVN01000771.1:584-3166(+)